MQILLLLIFLLPSASGADLWPFGGGGGNATKIRGVNVKTSLGCTDGQILKYVSANSQFECANDAGGVGSGDVGGGPSLTTAGRSVYVSGSSTITEDASFTRGATGQYTLYDPTATTGITTLTVRAGAGQSTTNLLEVKNASGTNVMSVAYNGGVVSAGNVFAGTSGGFLWASRSYLLSGADGNIALYANSGSTFGLLQFGGTASSFPALKRSSTSLAVRLADDSADAPISASNITASADFIGSSTSCIYLGATGTDGSWRFCRSSNDLVVSRRESGSWVAKGTWAP